MVERKLATAYRETLQGASANPLYIVQTSAIYSALKKREMMCEVQIQTDRGI